MAPHNSHQIESIKADLRFKLFLSHSDISNIGPSSACVIVKDRQVEDMDVTDLVFFWAEDSVLRAICSVGRCHAAYFGQISKHLGSGLGLIELCKGSGI